MGSPREVLGSRRLMVAVLAVVLAAAGLAAVVARKGGVPWPGSDQGVAAIPRSPCTGTRVLPGGDPQLALERGAEGDSFCFAAGTYRLTDPLRPRARQRLVAERGAVLNGSRVVGGWQRSGRTWSATGYLPAEPKVHGECVAGYDGCGHAAAVFLDDRQLWRVGSLGQLAP